MKYTVTQIETALDKGSLEVQGQSGKFYSVRRNGMTKRWKSRYDYRVRIPVKVGFSECFALEWNKDGIYTSGETLRINGEA